MLHSSAMADNDASTNLKSTSNENTSSSILYSSKLKKKPTKVIAPVRMPKKEDAIVFPIIENVSNETYVLALLECVKPESIIFASRMSNARLCIYLDSKATVDLFMEQYGYINLNDNRVVARRLINPAKKLLLSNVCPIIPNEILQDALQTAGLVLCSPIVYLQAGFATPAVQHILSFRRAVYFCSLNTEQQKLPDSIVIKFEEDEYRIFLSTEQTLVCFTCKESGHLAKNCKARQTSMETTSEADDIGAHTKKRGAPSSISVNIDDEEPIKPNNQEDTDNIVPKVTRQIKKPKTELASKTKELKLTEEEKEKISKQIGAIKASKAMDCPFTADDLIELLPNIRSSKDKIGMARSFMADTHGLSLIIDEIKPQVRASTKRTLTAFQKVLSSGSNISDSEIDT